MQLLSRLPNKVKQIKNEVGGLFGSPIEAGQTSDSTPTSPTTIHDLTADSPEPLPLKDITPKFRTRAVPNLIEEDDEEHRVEIDSKSHKRLKSASAQGERSVRSSPFSQRDTTSSRKRGLSSPEERRALGEPEPSPKDAVKIQPPGFQTHSHISSTAPMPRPKKFHEGLKLVNTLDSSVPRSHKTALRYAIHEVQLSPAREKNTPGARKARNDSLASRENDHQFPNKRQRTENIQSETTPSHSVISIDSADEQTPPRRVQSQHHDEHAVVQGAREYGDLEMLDQPRPRLSFFAHRNTSSLHELSKVHSNDRLPQHNDEHVEKRQFMDDMLASPSQSYHSRQQRYGLQIPHAITPTQSRMVTVDDSPDELHDEAITVSSPTAKARILKRIGIPHQKKRKLTLTGDEGRLLRIGDLHEFKLYRYRLKSVLGFENTTVNEFELVLAPDLRHIWIFIQGSILDDEAIINLSLTKISKVDLAPEDTKVVLRTSANVIKGNKLSLDFASLKGQAEFLRKIEENAIFDTVTRDKEFMEKSFAKGRLDAGTPSGMTSAQPRHPPSTTARNEPFTPQSSASSEPAQIVRLIDRLDSPDPVMVVTSGLQATAASRKPSKVSYRLHQTNYSPSQRTITSPYFDSKQPERSTRSNTVPKIEVIECNDDELKDDAPRISDLISVKENQPLTIHGPMKKSESLSPSDFERLNDDEFLNDNLISFFLLYLQKQASPAELKRMHFFNTFFYSALTKDVKGRTNINYDAVARWTKHVNLFKRDYVIVPVNDNYHWFVMIICNLPKLKRGSGAEDKIEEDNQDEMTHSRELQHTINGDSDLMSPESARESFQELSLDDDSKPQVQREVTEVGRKHRKAIRSRGVKKYDVAKPVIITLDSLGQIRSATASHLKKYIACLASDPLQHVNIPEIDANSIPGMTAKGIPHQNNYSDCGLYLCMYMEQFILNPDDFVRKVLQREDNGPKWPTEITSRQLRERLAGLLSKLYEQQVFGKRDILLPALGSILVDMLPAEDEVIETLPPVERADITHSRILEAREEWELNKSRENAQISRSHPQHAKQMASNDNRPSSKPERPDDSPSTQVGLINTGELSAIALDSRSTELSNLADSIELTDDSESLEVIDVVQPEGSRCSIDDPAILAARIAQQRSPQKLYSPQKTSKVTQTPPRMRSDSVSTEFLTGTDSYDKSSDVIKSPRANTSSLQSTPRTLRSNTRLFSPIRSTRHEASTQHEVDDLVSSIVPPETVISPRRSQKVDKVSNSDKKSVRKEIPGDTNEEMLV